MDFPIHPEFLRTPADRYLQKTFFFYKSQDINQARFVALAARCGPAVIKVIFLCVHDDSRPSIIKSFL